MPPKSSKKKQQASIEKQKKPNRSDWYNLPNQPKSIHQVNKFDCVIKSWRSPSRQCTTTSSDLPTLVEIHGAAPSLAWGTLNILCKSWYKLGYVTMTVTGDCSPAFAYHSERIFSNTPYQLRRYPYKPQWVIEHCNIKEPYAPTQNMRFCSLIGFKGMFYAMSLQGSVVEIGDEVAGSDRLGITRIGGNRAMPSEESRHFREFMFVLDGEILVVLLVSRGTIEVVDYVEVFRLDVEKLLWVKMNQIGNRALFVGPERCMWAEACETGFKRDCIYFIHKWVDDWMVFDMTTRNILPAFDD